MVWAVRWYRICEEEDVLVDSFVPGLAVGRPYPWSNFTEWANPAKARRTTHRPSASSDPEVELDATHEEAIEDVEGASTGSSSYDDETDFGCSDPPVAPTV